MATVLDELSGFEFEEVMVDVFRHQGYRDVRQAVRTADEGRDITMIDDDGPGAPVGVVVECKHTATVGRPVVQKLHSAVKTHEFDGPRRGMVATTGRFTAPATEYAARVSSNPEDIDIDLLDGRQLRAIGEEIGMDLYSGRIEVLCDETLPAPQNAAAVGAVRDAAASAVSNLAVEDLPAPRTSLAFVPLLLVETEVDATFSTTVGVIHRVHERERLALSADRDGPAVLQDDIMRLAAGSARTPIPHGDTGGAAAPAERAQNTAKTEPDEPRDADVSRDGDERPSQEDHRVETETFDTVDIRRFGRTESEYIDWLVDRQRDSYEQTVRYTGDNNVTYTKTCTPSASDVRVLDVDPVYLPQATATTSLGEYEYDHGFVTNGTDRKPLVNEFDRCVHCPDDESHKQPITHCQNCGSLSCPDHIREERLVGDPVCTGCSVTGEFFFATKHFYDTANREAFTEEYAALPFYRKPLENPRLTAVLVGVAVLFVLVLLAGL